MFTKNAWKTIDRSLERICKILGNQENELNDILNSNATQDEKDVARSNFRAKKALAKSFIEDLAELISATQSKIAIYSVTKEAFQKQIKSADFATIMCDTPYCRLAEISLYPNKPYRIMFVESVENIL